MVEIKKINEWTWEIPKTGNMNVPGIVYASEKLMEKIKQDQTLTQVSNVACLKGILKASYAMPDAHQGYGFSIGGVAAFDLDEGIISPGGVGYDINCLTGDSKISSEDGLIPIKKFEKKLCKIETLDGSSFSLTNPIAFMKFKPKNKILKITTEFGDVLKATADHPILTKQGMVQIQYLKENVKIATTDGKIAWANIVDIREAKHRSYVFDFTVPKTHNFVANNIVVSNCGVRLLRTDLKVKDVLEKRNQLLNAIYEEVPAGVGKKGITRLSRDVLGEAVEKGAEWAVAEGYGTKEDLQRTEEYGRMKDADFAKVSDKATTRGMPQLGTLGAGNHFLEMQKVDEIYDAEVASRFGITDKGQIMVMIHSGSRGLGHQVASDYIKKMEEKYGFEGLPDRELINAPINSDLGQAYYKAMSCAVNFAFVNRQMIMHWTRGVFKKVFGSNDNMDLIYDVCHNIAKFEKHIVDDSGKMKKVCIHRKGATRSFGPGREEIPDVYREVGQPVIIPGSMGTASYLLVGTKKAEEVSFGSTAHGAGRVSSRAEALRTLRGEQVVKDLNAKGIEVKGASWKGIAEEAPQMYKDIDEVVKVSDKLGIGRPVVRLVPLAVMKG